MLVRPNRTVLRGHIRGLRPDPSGHGEELQVEITENVSPSDADDFLKPLPGSTVTLYTHEPPSAGIGDLVEIEANLLAGPFGEKAVSSAMRTLKASPKPSPRS